MVKVHQQSSKEVSRRGGVGNTGRARDQDGRKNNIGSCPLYCTGEGMRVFMVDKIQEADSRTKF